MVKKPQLLQATVVAQSRLFEIECLHLRFDNGQERHFERIGGQENGSVMIVPLLDQETVLLVREYAAGVGDYVLGFPKGAVEKEEDWLKTAARELQEEVGYGARRLSLLTRLSASPAYLCSMMRVVLAEELYPQKAEGDEPEPMEVIPWKLRDIDALLHHSEFHEARSVAALCLLERQRRDS
ncbi:MAG: ADP compounds hydrolase NudE [Coxiella sp. RIFCSPHIGHO2_12_FULL_44_14]|nr:MAG: ADP compounds hydrolase NudE [Coxiella sp. RIFCSPHIGHO2_12_FULL_44_14]